MVSLRVKGLGLVVADDGVDETYFPGRAASIWRSYKDGKTEQVGTFGM